MQQVKELWDRIVFRDPHYLILLWIVLGFMIVFAAALVLRFRRAPRRTYGSRYPSIPKMKFWFLAIFLASLTALALARPCLKNASMSFSRGNVDVIVAIDNSIST